MTFSSFVSSLARAWRFSLASALFGALIVIGISLLFPLKYSSTTRLLVTQANAAGLDPYTALKSTEQIATSLRELVYTSLFSNNVLSGTKDFQATYFSSNENDKREQWQKTVDVSVAPGTGIMTVVVYHERRDQAKALVEGVSRELMAQVPNFFGYNAKAQVIDTPLDSRWFAKPNLLLSAVFGALIGLVWSFAYLLLKWWEMHR